VGWGALPDSIVSYVEEDQEAQGAHAPLEANHGKRPNMGRG
jgi:hypothetical protein